MSRVTPDDSIILLAEGYALAEHVDPALVYPQEPLPLDLVVDVAS